MLETHSIATLRPTRKFRLQRTDSIAPPYLLLLRRLQLVPLRVLVGLTPQAVLPVHTSVAITVPNRGHVDTVRISAAHARSLTSEVRPREQVVLHRARRLDTLSTIIQETPSNLGLRYA